MISKFRLAEHLHKTVAEIEGMSVSEFHGWIAYLGGKHGR